MKYTKDAQILQVFNHLLSCFKRRQYQIEHMI